MSARNGRNNETPVPPKSCKVYTPFSLAEAVANALGDEPTARWLEPSHGHGAFLRALRGLGVPKTRIRAIDLEIKASPDDRLARTSRGIDFLDWYGVTSERFDRIIGNPPFVAISQLPLVLQKTAASILDLNGKPIGRGANTWYAFVLASLRLLQKGGSFGFLLPSAAEYADYSKALRESVAKSFRTLEIYRCHRPLFADVQEGTILAIARGYKQGPGVVHRREVRSLNDLERRLRRGPGPGTHPCRRNTGRSHPNTKTLGELATVGLGGVTGDVGFFLLTDQERKDLQLPLTSLIPVVSRARHLRDAVIDPVGWNALKRDDQRVWLFDPPGSDLADRHVQEYLRRRASDGGCHRSRYKVCNREPWYRTPLPKEPHGFISGMSQHGPWICFSGMKGLNATNTLYVIRFHDEINENIRFGWALAMLTSAAQRQILSLGRRYADGLRKYEPGGLKTVRLVTPASGLVYHPLYVQAVKALLNSQPREAQKTADEALQPR
jgi:adenine-specific DNA-methyltransferase